MKSFKFVMILDLLVVGGLYNNMNKLFLYGCMYNVLLIFVLKMKLCNNNLINIIKKGIAVKNPNNLITKYDIQIYETLLKRR